MILVGIDPSSTATGVVTLSVRRPEKRSALWTPGHDAVEVLRRVTIRPKGNLTERLDQLFGDLSDELEVACLECGDGASITFVCENPIDHPYQNAGAAAGMVGSAFGVAAVALWTNVESCAGDKIHFIDSQDWIPKVEGRGNRKMPHRQAREYLKLRWPGLKPCTDDETMAAGCALYHIGAEARDRLAERTNA